MNILHLVINQGNLIIFHLKKFLAFVIVKVPMYRKEEEERQEWELLKLINTSRTIYID